MGLALDSKPNGFVQKFNQYEKQKLWLRVFIRSRVIGVNDSPLGLWEERLPERLRRTILVELYALSWIAHLQS